MVREDVREGARRGVQEPTGVFVEQCASCRGGAQAQRASSRQGVVRVLKKAGAARAVNQAKGICNRVFETVLLSGN